MLAGLNCYRCADVTGASEHGVLCVAHGFKGVETGVEGCFFRANFCEIRRLSRRGSCTFLCQW